MLKHTRKGWAIFFNPLVKPSKIVSRQDLQHAQAMQLLRHLEISFKHLPKASYIAQIQEQQFTKLLASAGSWIPVVSKFAFLVHEQQKILLMQILKHLKVFLIHFLNFFRQVRFAAGSTWGLSKFGFLLRSFSSRTMLWKDGWSKYVPNCISRWQSLNPNMRPNSRDAFVCSLFCSMQL